MARGRRERTDKRRGAVLGWVLIALLLAALAAGGFAVYRAAAYWRNKVIQNGRRRSAQSRRSRSPNRSRSRTRSPVASR